MVPGDRRTGGKCQRWNWPTSKVPSIVAPTETRSPSLEVAFRMAEVFGVRVDEVFHYGKAGRRCKSPDHTG